MLKQFCIFTILSILAILPGSYLAQEIPIGTWREHLPYSNAVSVSFNNGIVYCASESAIFMYDRGDKTIERLTPINGLSDIGLSKIKYNPFNRKIVVAYENGNLDVIEENRSITNLSFIKNSNVVGSKSINHIHLVDELAYLSTGFGIVVLNTEKLEIEDTYLIGDLGAYINVNGVTLDNDSIYAATDEGVYAANKLSSNLADYNEWNKIPALGNIKYSAIAFYMNQLFTSSDTSGFEGDSIYYNPSGVWQTFTSNSFKVKDLKVVNGSLIVTNFNNVEQFDASLNKVKTVYTFQGQFNLRPLEADLTGDNFLLIAEQDNGLIIAKDNWNTEIIVPNSPSSANAFQMDFLDGELWTVSGGYGLSLEKNLVNHQSDGVWSDLGNKIKDLDGNDAADMVNVVINPSNSSNVYVSSWRNGLLEYNNDNLTTIYNAQNSALDSVFFGITAIGAMTFDTDGNLWVTSSYSDNILAVKTPDNSWYNYSFPGLTSTSNFYTQMIVDENNYKWIISPDANKIIIFDDNGTLNNTGDDRVKTNANFPGTSINEIIEDLDGEIWIGTDEGIAVFYDASNVFEGNIEADQILIQQDGITQILLETEIVTCIKVDGANRKWIGTQNSGVYLMSADGTEEVEHFTTENSPLFSNNIFDIVINPKTGEVYIGTEKGLLSYKGTATDADTDFNNVFVYPNPVKPGYSGVIAIRGLVKDTDVRITDISGNIVYETTSLGGQAVWDGNDFNGNRVRSGVYMVFNGSQDGSKKAAAKILFVN